MLLLVIASKDLSEVSQLEICQAQAEDADRCLLMVFAAQG